MLFFGFSEVLQPCLYFFINILYIMWDWSFFLSHSPDDGNLQAETDSGSFWVLFGGFAPIGKKDVSEDDIVPDKTPAKLFRYCWILLSYICL